MKFNLVFGFYLQTIKGTSKPYFTQANRLQPFIAARLQRTRTNSVWNIYSTSLNKWRAGLKYHLMMLFIVVLLQLTFQQRVLSFPGFQFQPDSMAIRPNKWRVNSWWLSPGWVATSELQTKQTLCLLATSGLWNFGRFWRRSWRSLDQLGIGDESSSGARRRCKEKESDDERIWRDGCGGR